MAFVKTCGPWRLGPDVRAVFLPAEPWLTLRKVSRDPFSMNSVMIITGLPTETHDKAVVSEAGLQGRKTNYKEMGSSGVPSCGQPFSLSLCFSLGYNMAFRHQSHWQLLISPLYKRQDIIRMDQSARMCVCVLCVCKRGASWDLMNSNQPRGEGGCGRIAVHLHLHECVFVCMCVWWRGGWLTGPTLDGPLHDIWWGLQIINKVPAIKYTYTLTSKNSSCPCFTGLSRDTTPYSWALPITNKHVMCSYKWRCVCVCVFVACKHRLCQLWWIGHIFTIRPQRCWEKTWGTDKGRMRGGKKTKERRKASYRTHLIEGQKCEKGRNENFSLSVPCTVLLNLHVKHVFKEWLSFFLSVLLTLTLYRNIHWGKLQGSVEWGGRGRDTYDLEKKVKH